MIFHFSIPTDEPERVARVLAEIWQGEAFPFFPHRNESWAVFKGDEHGTSVECYPRGIQVSPSQDEHPMGFVLTRPPADAALPASARFSTTHAAIGTQLSQEEVMAIGKREGWLSRYAQRGLFGVVELWLENAVLFEVLTPELQKQYVDSQTLEAWRAMAAAFKAKQGGLAAS